MRQRKATKARERQPLVAARQAASAESGNNPLTPYLDTEGQHP